MICFHLSLLNQRKNIQTQKGKNYCKWYKNIKHNLKVKQRKTEKLKVCSYILCILYFLYDLSCSYSCGVRVPLSQQWCLLLRKNPAVSSLLRRHYKHFWLCVDVTSQRPITAASDYTSAQLLLQWLPFSSDKMHILQLLHHLKNAPKKKS